MTPAVAQAWLQDSLLAAFFASVLFALGATVLFPWWESRLGRALVTMDVLWTLTMLPLILAYFGLNERGVFYTQYFAATLTLTAGAALWRLWVIFAEQRLGRKRRARRREGSNGHG